jgi:hypothetical protein
VGPEPRAQAPPVPALRTLATRARGSFLGANSSRSVYGWTAGQVPPSSRAARRSALAEPVKEALAERRRRYGHDA